MEFKEPKSYKPLLNNQLNQGFLSEFNTTVISTEDINLKNNSSIIKNNQFQTPTKKQYYSLFNNPNISKTKRYSILISIILTTLLFLWANLSISASVVSHYVFGPFTTPDNDMGQLSLLNSVKDMWTAGVYILALLIAFGSGIWPYIKLMMMTLCWLVNERYISYKTREKIIIVLDVAGKWAMVDAYVMILLIAGFRFQAKGDILQFKAESDVIVIPEWGYYGFLLACIISLILTHIILHTHRSLKQITIQINNNPQQNSLKTKNTYINMLIIFLIIISSVLCFIGSFVNSFNYEFAGASAKLLPEDQVVQNYSIASLGYQFPGDMEDPQSFGAYFLTFLFFTLSILLPMLFFALITVLFLKKMNLYNQRKLFTITEIIYAWSTLDVMVLSLIVTVLETEQFAEFNVGDSCAGINQLLQSLNDNPLIPIQFDPPVCFTVRSSLNKGIILLTIAGVIFLIFGSIILRVLKNQLDKHLINYKQIQDNFTTQKINKYNNNNNNQQQQNKEQKSHINFKIKQLESKIKVTQIEENEEYLFKQSIKSNNIHKISFQISENCSQIIDN